MALEVVGVQCGWRRDEERRRGGRKQPRGTVTHSRLTQCWAAVLAGSAGPWWAEAAVDVVMAVAVCCLLCRVRARAWLGAAQARYTFGGRLRAEVPGFFAGAAWWHGSGSGTRPPNVTLQNSAAAGRVQVQGAGRADESQSQAPLGPTPTSRKPTSDTLKHCPGFFPGTRDQREHSCSGVGH